MMKSFESSIQSYFIRSLGMSQIQQILQCSRKKNTIRLNNPHSSHAKRQIKIEIPDLFANKRVRKKFARSRSYEDSAIQLRSPWSNRKKKGINEIEPQTVILHRGDQRRWRWMYLRWMNASKVRQFRGKAGGGKKSN